MIIFPIIGAISAGIGAIGLVFMIVDTSCTVDAIDKKVDQLTNYQPRPRYYPSDSD